MTTPYDDATFDAEVLRTQRSDASFVAVRVVMLAVTFFYLGRAIVHGASAGFLLLPLVFEFVSIMWLGLVLGYFVVDCPHFIATTRRPVRVLMWTLLIVGVLSGVLAWGDGGGFDATRIRPGWVAAWHEVVRTGLVWAMLAELVGLIVSTVREVVGWRRDGGVFGWGSVFAPSFRVAVVILLAVFSPFVLIPLADSALPWLVETRERLAWAVFAFLLVVEAGGLAIGVGLHRSLKAKPGLQTEP